MNSVYNFGDSRNVQINQGNNSSQSMNVVEQSTDAVELLKSIGELVLEVGGLKIDEADFRRRIDEASRSIERDDRNPKFLNKLQDMVTESLSDAGKPFLNSAFSSLFKVLVGMVV